jgi:hypothetical protein
VAALTPQEILDHRLVKKDNASYLQVLIKWSSMPASMATWEDWTVLWERYPDAAAWGQAAFQGDGSVTPVPPGGTTTSEGKAYSVVVCST